jgi:hypothetical protein
MTNNADNKPIKPYYTVTELAEILNMSSPSIYRHIKEKSISTDRDKEDKIIINEVEIRRVYGDDVFYRDRKQSTKQDAIREQNNGDNRVLEGEISHLKDKVSFLEEQLKRRDVDFQNAEEREKQLRQELFKQIEVNQRILEAPKTKEKQQKQGLFSSWFK